MTSTDQPATILLVDDDNVLRDVLSRVLTRDGYTVVPAAGVAEALDAAKEHTLSLALVDLSLPDGDGVSLADSLHKHQADLPLILMTAYPIRLREDPEIGSRFRRVMIKPLNLDELRTAIKEALSGEPVAKAPVLSEAAATTPTPVRTVEPAFPAEPARPPNRWAWVQSAATFGVAAVALAIFAVFISGVPIPGITASGKEETAPAPPPPDVQLVKEPPHTLFIPADVKQALGILKGGVDDVATAEIPRKGRPLVLTGTTALDPTRILRARTASPPPRSSRSAASRANRIPKPRPRASRASCAPATASTRATCSASFSATWSAPRRTTCSTPRCSCGSTRRS